MPDPEHMATGSKLSLIVHSVLDSSRNHLSQLTYPNGPIYIGLDLTNTLTYGFADELETLGAHVGPDASERYRARFDPDHPLYERACAEFAAWAKQERRQMARIDASFALPGEGYGPPGAR